MTRAAPYIILFFLCLFAQAPAALAADTPLIVGNLPLPLKPYLSLLQDDGDHYTAGQLFRCPGLFKIPSGFSYGKPNDIYWLRTRLQSRQSLYAALTFGYLTFTDLYLFNDADPGHPLHREAGAFRAKKFIDPEDSRFSFLIPLKKDTHYTLLLQVQHIKGYKPNFDFSLASQADFIAKQRQKELTDIWMQGAISILFIYTFFSWLSSRFRPYLWMMMFLAGIGLYDLSLSPYFTDWFMPGHPKNSLLLTQHFLHLGLIGFYLLIMDFWDLREKDPIFYRVGEWMIAGLMLLSIISFCINNFTGNFYLSSQIHIWLSPVNLAYLLPLMVRMRNRLDHFQRFLFYGIILFLVAVALIAGGAFIFAEKAQVIVPYVSKGSILTIVVILLTGLKERLKLHETHRAEVLTEVMGMFRDQNKLLEEKVSERTAELQQRNARVEVLINEINHRVKNNLQLLYSLNSLQLESVKDHHAIHILKDNLARIKAMMLVNANFDLAAETQRFNLNTFIENIVRNSHDIFDRDHRVRIRLNVPRHITLEATQSLSFGLILSELITNSFKYAFAEHISPEIRINVRQLKQGSILFSFQDNGPGLKADHKPNLGLSLIKDLTRQLRGTVEIKTQNGLTYLFFFPFSHVDPKP